MKVAFVQLIHKKFILWWIVVGIFQKELLHNKQQGISLKNCIMKRSLDFRLVIILIASILYTISSSSQGFNKLDNAPHDISYYRESRVTTPLVKVIYGRPSIKTEGEVFGTEVPFNKLWRTGANEATEIKIYKDVMFGDKLVS